MTIIILKPHKSIDKIQKEYNVKLSDDELYTLAKLTVDCMINDDYEPLEGACMLLALRHKVPKDKIDDFVNDLCRTSIFYVKSLMLIVTKQNKV